MAYELDLVKVEYRDIEIKASDATLVGQNTRTPQGTDPGNELFIYRTKNLILPPSDLVGQRVPFLSGYYSFLQNISYTPESAMYFPDSTVPVSLSVFRRAAVDVIFGKVPAVEFTFTLIAPYQTPVPTGNDLVAVGKLTLFWYARPQ